ncbi:hypothetical protein NDU88_010439 [Pleurodeles waltl]|uniref:Uncharacterized protein n=1 Tax=Pleurodeles waltl TaxID=8319 RepID=A0AAV7Q280_PLEWA|nr:hypothetical protein NDU88_010439 [Pleurodeles waltl]
MVLVASPGCRFTALSSPALPLLAPRQCVRRGGGRQDTDAPPSTSLQVPPPVTGRLAPEAKARLPRRPLSVSVEAPASRLAADLGSAPRSGFQRGARVSPWGSRPFRIAGLMSQGWHGVGGSQSASGSAPLAARPAVLRSP